MSFNAPSRCLALAMAAALSAMACAKAATAERGTAPRTVGGHTYITQAVPATLGPHRFMFPANLYYNQIGPFADGGIMLAVFWPDFEAASPGDRPLRSVEDSQRQVLIALSYLDRIPIKDYLNRRSSNDATTEADSLRRRNPAQRLELRVAQPERWGLTPYLIDSALMAQYAKDAEAKLGMTYVHNPALEPDWYIVRSKDGQLRTFISCDPADRTADGLAIKGRTLQSVGGDQIAMCRHSMVDIDDSIIIEMSYARVMLGDWQRLEAAVHGLMRRYRVGS